MNVQLYPNNTTMSAILCFQIWVEYYRNNLKRWPRVALYPQKLALASSTSGGRSVGIVRSRTQATEFFFCLFRNNLKNEDWESYQQASLSLIYVKLKANGIEDSALSYSVTNGK
jgi:hypothetical protein